MLVQGGNVAPIEISVIISCGSITGCGTLLCKCKKERVNCHAACVNCTTDECTNYTCEQETEHSEDEGLTPMHNSDEIDDE